MDFTKIKKWFADFKKKAEEKIDEAIDYGAKKVAESGVTVKTKEELDKLIDESTTTTYTNKETELTKQYIHTSILVVGDEESEFFQKALLKFPILSTKAFSQNVVLKLAKSNIEWVDFSKYDVKELPAMVIFREEKHYKTISGEENINKIVKSLKLDIVEQIEAF